ncbi:LysR family transcriptional regulator [Burkholderia sp. FERM BP-3421]|uniref:LysR family transcriptional regulator n=1 Tax=Burkholderia sp. FERM BP-3421 TaxID=1494466 RepID=UPI00236225EF|nr:LysR family transcriptional regulator [Burkholderia sp. FERM BP-3421]WDD92485.1 LysR family transcriptional regulator [Burkholderia sp. FERM BP-3421]
MDLLSAMRIFVRVVERGSMSAAARDLGIGQPAVSERIEKLEQHLGARLLRRSTRAVSCTDAGARFYERSRIVLAAAQDAQDAVARDQRAVRGTLRLAAPQGLGEVVLPALLARLRERHPALDVDLVLNDRVVDPVTEGVDLSLRLGEPGVGNVVARRLGEVRRVLVASPAYLEHHDAPTTPQALIAHPFARVAGLFGDQHLPLVDASGKLVQARLTVAWNASHWRPVHEWILAGAAIGVLQAPVCAAALAAGTLVPLLPGYTVPGFALHALYPAARPIPAKTRAALALLESHLPAMLG